MQGTKILLFGLKGSMIHIGILRSSHQGWILWKAGMLRRGEFFFVFAMRRVNPSSSSGCSRGPVGIGV
jgi:hypothetical protein